MAWIKIIEESDAEGLLARIYEAARGRSGKVFNILKVQSTHPPVLKAMIELYQAAMLSESPLSRAQREMLAVVVSRANNCHYWIEAHAFDLRAEVDNREWVEQIKRDYRAAELTEVDRALCDHAIKLTRTPAAVGPSDLDHLRKLGLSDRAIHDATQVISFFNYINRIGDGLGVDLEPGMPAPGRDQRWWPWISRDSRSLGTADQLRATAQALGHTHETELRTVEAIESIARARALNSQV